MLSVFKGISMRLTYRSAFGDYGCAQTFKDEWDERNAFRNKLGKFEDAFEWNAVAKVGNPKEEGTYYVTAHDALGTMKDVVLRDEFHDGTFGLEKVDFKVTAWMPIYIPEPYTGDE